VSLASLPHNIPFNLGGLVRPGEVKAYGLTGVLPKRIPFNLSNQQEPKEVPFGSIGWELVCRAWNDFQTILLKTNDMTALTFTKELNAFGIASFALNLDHDLFRDNLNGGYSIETLFDYENLWEICFDGRVIFQALGTAVNDSMLNSNESRNVTITGSGTGRVLEWASVYPPGFPDYILTKLETLNDPFSGETVKTSIWTSTALQPNVQYVAAGMRDEADTELDTLTQERSSLQSQRTSALATYNGEKTSYAAVMKDTTSTKTEKNNALKKLNEAKAELDKIDKALNVNQASLDRANAIRTFIGVPPEDDSFGHAKITLTQAGSRSLTSRNYEFADSGVSVGIEPGPSSSTG
jgi:hypothetical protein